MTATLQAGNVLNNFREMEGFIQLHEQTHAREISEQEFKARGTAREHQAMGGQMYGDQAIENADKIVKGSELDGVGLVDMDDTMSR